MLICLQSIVSAGYEASSLEVLCSLFINKCPQCLFLQPKPAQAFSQLDIPTRVGNTPTKLHSLIWFTFECCKQLYVQCDLQLKQDLGV